MKITRKLDLYVMRDGVRRFIVTKDRLSEAVNCGAEVESVKRHAKVIIDMDVLLATIPESVQVKFMDSGDVEVCTDIGDESGNGGGAAEND